MSVLKQLQSHRDTVKIGSAAYHAINIVIELHIGLKPSGTCIPSHFMDLAGALSREKESSHE